jgi:hypothetical protein
VDVAFAFRVTSGDATGCCAQHRTSKQYVPVRTSSAGTLASVHVSRMGIATVSTQAVFESSRIMTDVVYRTV